MAEEQGIYILAEITGDKKPSPLTLELMGLGGELASQLDEGLFAILLGSSVSPASEELAGYGAGEVFVLDDPGLSEYNPDTYLAVLEEFFESKKPRVILSGHTSVGQDLLPRLAFALGAGLVTDCVGLEADTAEGGLKFIRPVYGGNAFATRKVKTATAMATVRARVGEAPLPSGEAGKITLIDLEIPGDTGLKITGRESGERQANLEEAPVVVTGGRGIGGAEGFEQLEELARLLGGAVGASRPPCDSGWAPTTSQVGITGKVVAPDIYIAVAISGSSQHLSGMSESGKIVAINKDPEAYIFKTSDYGVVGDWKQVLPAFTARLKELKEG